MVYIYLHENNILPSKYILNVGKYTIHGVCMGKDPIPFPIRVGFMVPIPGPTIGLVRVNPEILGHTWMLRVT